MQIVCRPCEKILKDAYGGHRDHWLVVAVAGKIRGCGCADALRRDRSADIDGDALKFIGSLDVDADQGGRTAPSPSRVSCPAGGFGLLTVAHSVTSYRWLSQVWRSSRVANTMRSG